VTIQLQLAETTTTTTIIIITVKLLDFVSCLWRNGTQGFFLKTKQEVMQSQPIDIRRRIFQGDSLSPLLFCITNIPLTNELNRADCGYQVRGAERKISYVLYMDDLKLLGKNENDMQNEIKIVQAINKDMNMNFGSEKCARICLKRGRIQSKMHIESTFENDIKELEPRKHISV
jgi:hypothetical protein